MADSQKENILGGQLIYKQGEKYDYLCLLISGTIEILSADPEYNGLDETILLKNSRRVGKINEKTFLASFADKTVRAVTDCTIQKIKIPPKGISQFALSNPGQAITLLMHLFKRNEAAYSDYQKITKFFKTISAFTDNLSLIYKELSAKELPERLEQITSEISGKVDSANLPATFDCSFLVSDKSSLLGRNYDIQGQDANKSFDKNQYAFLKRFLKVDKNIFGHLLKADPGICGYINQTVSKYFTNFLNSISDCYPEIEHKMDILFGKDDSWYQHLFSEGGIEDCMASGRLNAKFIQQLNTVTAKIYQTYQEMSGQNSEEDYPGYQYLKNFLQQTAITSPAPGTETSSGDTSSAGEGADKILRLYDNSLQQIFKFSVAGEELQRNLLTSLNEFKKMENPFTTESDARKIRRKISNFYWDLFYLVFIRKQSLPENKIPAPVKLMIEFGFIDENMAEPEQILFMHQKTQMKEKSQIPVITENEFLQKIHDGKVQPSINEMGLDFRKHLLEEGRMNARRGEDPLTKLEDPASRLHFEIHNMLTSTSGLCSGSRSTAFPLFTKELLHGDLSNFYLSKKDVEKKITDLINIDFSAYYRETVLKLESSREVIFEEVIPYFILLPSYGTKIMMWQELSGTNKRSRARIVLPRFYMGDLFQDLAHATAAFRWELNRTMKGGMWADPVEGGITGFYSDYVQFYKKNSQLSREAKEKVKQKLSSARNNTREMFAQDYILWVTYEQQGIMKMNSVVRDMFYRFIPFSREIRDRLGNMPAFAESARRFQNIRNREYKAAERKFKKYEDESGNLPEAIKKHMEYFQL